MTFKHELFRRLAVASGAAAVAVVFACDKPASLTGPGGPVASVTVSPAGGSVQIGGVLQLSAVLKNSAGDVLTGRTVTWASGNPSVVTVSGTGLAKGITLGSTTVTATSEGKSGTATVAVINVPVASVAVTPATATIEVGQTVQLTATPQDGDGNPLPGRTVTWDSNNPSIATVSSSGLVTAVFSGSALITATSEGKVGKSAIFVTNVPVASVTVTPATATIPVGQTVQLTATPNDANGKPLAGRTVTWSSNPSSVATVNSSGLVTAVTAGSATITATSEGQNGTSAITVTP